MASWPRLTNIHVRNSRQQAILSIGIYTLDFNNQLSKHHKMTQMQVLLLKR